LSQASAVTYEESSKSKNDTVNFFMPVLCA
jgi:hypothetical protein